MAVTILGISPGTRLMGIGVIRDGELIEWQVKTFKQSWSKEKCKNITLTIEELCNHFKVTEIALKVVSPLRTSRSLFELTTALKDCAKVMNIDLLTFTIQDLKREVGPSGKHSMDDLMEYFTEKFPVLKREYLKERNNLNAYYLKMFEAIAAAWIVRK